MKRSKKSPGKASKVPKPKPKVKPKPKPRPTEGADFELDHVGEWTDEHTKVIARLLVDLEEAK